VSDITDQVAGREGERYATQAEAFDPPAEPFAPQAGIGVSLSVGVFGFSVIMLGLAQAHIFTPNAVGIFVPVALGLGATGLIFGGVFEMRANNVFAGTFSLLYAGFLIATGLILRTFSPDIIKAAGAGGFGDAFGVYLLMWAIFTAFFTYGAYYVNLPAFLAFLLLTIVYLLAGIVNISSPESNFLLNLSGWVAIADGICAWWVGFGLVLNDMGPRPIIPMPATRGSR
jgi:succinate-acetate transporter protein